MESKKKTIGCAIAYYKNHNNYGTTLQGYATIMAIKQLGHNCRIIRYVKKDTIWRKLTVLPLQLASGGWRAYKTKKKKQNVSNLSGEYQKQLKVRTEVNNAFKEARMEEMADEYVGYKNLQEGSSLYDAVLVGSDQVWTPLGLYSRFFNLQFVQNGIRRISYASSFGVCNIPWWQHHSTRKYLNAIDYLSVREIRAKEIVDDLSDKHAIVVADPTLLLAKDSWQELIKNCTPKTTGEYIFCYLLGKRQEIRDEIRRLSKNTKLKIVAIRHTDEYLEMDNTFGDEAPYDVDPFDFIKLIANAKYVCTDSFHCTVFSIIFQKQFLTFYRLKSSDGNSRNSRIDSLLNIFGLEERLFQCDIKTQMEKYIDYNEVQQKLDILRSQSLDFLKHAIEDEKC